MTHHATIARLLNQAGEHLKAAADRRDRIGHDRVTLRGVAASADIDAAMVCIHQAFLETLGPGAKARQAVPAGWVVRAKHPEHGVVYVISADGGTDYCHPTKAHVFGTEADAQNAAYVRAWGSKWTRAVVPVDAAGNIIEGGVAWEAARSYEEAERLRAELDAALTERADLRIALRAVEAERDQLAEAHRAVSAVAEDHARAWHSLVDRIRTMADEVCGMQPVIAATEALSLIESKVHTLRTALHRTEVERDAARAERDAAQAERDTLTTDEADLRYALRTIASLVGGAVALGASTETHCATADEVRLVVERLKREEALSREGERIAVAERDALAAELQRCGVPDAVQLAGRANIADDRLAVHDERLDNVHARLAALEHRAPVARDHSEVIAQCEEAPFVADAAHIAHAHPGRVRAWLGCVARLRERVQRGHEEDCRSYVGGACTCGHEDDLAALGAVDAMEDGT